MSTGNIFLPRLKRKSLSCFLGSVFLAYLVLLFLHPAAFAGGKSIGIIITGDGRYYREMQNAFMAKLGREGYDDKVRVIVQKPYPDNVSLSNAVRKLMAIDVDLIITYGTAATMAAFREKTKIPVVYAGVYEPIASKLRDANMTGVSARPSVSSLLRYVRGTTSLKNIGIIYNSAEEDSLFQAREVYKMSGQYGLRSESINIRGVRAIKAALAGRKLDALFITSSSLAEMASSEIEEFSRTYRIPTASLVPGRSFLITLCANPRDLGEKAAERAIKILTGTHPEKIARTSSNDTELVFNLKEAVNMGFDIPAALVTEATRLIK